MRFSQLEDIMQNSGVSTLADIARALGTTPQAVSNWKSRDHVPYHVETKLNQMNSNQEKSQIFNSSITTNGTNDDTVSIPDVLLTFAEQLKVIFLVTFIFTFCSFVYVKFIQEEKFLSSATILLPEIQANNMGGLAGLASQFGVNVPSGNTTIDLSSPSLIPELLKSRTFAEKLLYKEFYSSKLNKKIPLVEMLFNTNEIDRDAAIYKGSKTLNSSIISYRKNTLENFSIINVTFLEPQLTKDIADSVIHEIESLNKFFKVQSTNEKLNFIENRIKTVDSDLRKSELKLKKFNEQNRQISSPALQLDLDRLSRDVELQKNIYLTLKQQHELAKIEEVQKSSILQVLDKPFYPLGPINKNLPLSLFFAISLGLFVGSVVGFLRSFRLNADKNDKKKYRRMKSFFIKNIKSYFFDYRISAINSLVLILGYPFYFLYQFDKGSFHFFSNIIYLLLIILFLTLFFFKRKKNRKTHVQRFN